MSIVQFDLKEKDPHAANSASARTDPFSGKYPSRTLEPGTSRPRSTTTVFNLVAGEYPRKRENDGRRGRLQAPSTRDGGGRATDGENPSCVVRRKCGGSSFVRGAKPTWDVYKRGTILSRSAGSTFPNPDHYGLAVFVRPSTCSVLLYRSLPEALM